MPDAIPPVLLPYIQDSLVSARLILIGSTLSTPANWLVVRFLHAAIHASKHDPDSAQDPAGHHDATSGFVLVSLLRPIDLWIELGKKIVGFNFLSPCCLLTHVSQGLDIVGLCNARKLRYIDGLSSSILSSTKSPMPVARLKSLSLAEITTKIGSVTTSNSNSLTGDGGLAAPVVILDGLDFLLASQPDIGIRQVQNFLSSIRAMSQAVVLTCSTDAPLLHNRHDGASPLERGHAALLSTVTHQSSRIFQLRGLDTGTARDITGVLRISCGPDYADQTDESRGLEDGEWLYQIKGDGGIRMWTRGE